MQIVFKLITLEERASNQIHLKSHERLGNRMHGFRQGATNREISSKVLFSFGNEERGDQFKSPFYRNADPSNLGRSLLEGNKDHLLSQARSELVKQEHQVRSLNTCINELPLTMDMLNLEENLQEELSLKEKVLRDTQIRSMHEMGEMKRAQELRVDEVSMQKLREHHETIQKLTSQLQCMQEHMNSMDDSGESREVESNPGGRLSHVPSQPAMIPSSSSMLSRDKRLPIDTWNAPRLQENFCGNQFSTLGSPRNPSQGIHHGETRRETEAVPRAIGTGSFFAGR